MKKRFFSIVYMFLLTLAFTSLVTVVKVLSEERIETNQRVKLERIVLKVLDVPVPAQASDEKLREIFRDRVKAIQVKDKTLYIHYDKNGRNILGYAFPVGGPGFWGPVFGMVAVGPNATKILGLAFYRHSETPGLGARMTEDWFTKQFSGLSLYPITGQKKIFYLKPEGTGKDPNELDAITGATNTSAAIESFLNRDLDQFLREIWDSVRKEAEKNA